MQLEGGGVVAVAGVLLLVLRYPRTNIRVVTPRVRGATRVWS